MSKFWLEDPAVLMKHDELTKIWPLSTSTTNEKLNALTRFVVILTFISYVASSKSTKAKVIISGLVTLMAIIAFYYIKKQDMIQKLIDVTKREGFSNSSHIKESDALVTEPKSCNPMMNVMLHEIHDNPERKPAAKSFHPEVEEKINEATKEFVTSNFDGPSVRSKLFDDLGDSFTFDRSMRAWHPTANTQIPNDQKGFAEFCYGGMVSCKDGHELACVRSAPHRWMNN